MTKEQILATVEPRTVKIILFKNSWGEQVGDGGTQALSEAYFTSGNILGGMVYYNTTVNPVYSPSAWQQFAIWFQTFFKFQTTP